MPSTFCKVCRKVTGSKLFKYCSEECWKKTEDYQEHKRFSERSAIALAQIDAKLAKLGVILK